MQNTDKTVLVSGGAGFIGRHTVSALAASGFKIIIADRKPKPVDLPYKYYCLDVSSPETEKIFQENKINYIIHLAALPSVADSIKYPLIDARDNYLASVNICSLAKKYGAEKIVFSSTAAVYAHPEYLPADEKHPVSYLSPYAITKSASENYIKYCGLDYIIFRYSNVYGPGQDASGEAGVIAKFFDLMTKNKPVYIHGSGRQYRDFIYVSDVSRANVLALESDIKNEIINVSMNTKTSINELFNTMKEVLNYKLEPVYTAPRGGDIEKSVLDNRKLAALLHFAPSIDIKTGIKTAVRFMPVLNQS